MKRVVISRPETGDEVNLSLFRRGFTLGELSIVLVVMTLVVMVTLPITLSKMKKVDYISYWMGYSLIKDISANALPEILDFENNGDDECAFTLDGKCFGAPFTPSGLRDWDCEDLKDELGIKKCCSRGEYFCNGIDYWGGAVRTCGGVDKMPTLKQLALIADYFYHTSGIGDKENISESAGLTLDYERVAEYGITPTGGTPDARTFTLWSGEEIGNIGTYAGSRYFYSDSSGYYSNDRNYSRVIAVCILGESEDLASKLCEKIKRTYNIDASDCSIPFETIKAETATGVFTEVSPHIVFSNGLKLYIGSDLGTISELSDAEDELDREGFEIYIDVNGESGKSILWEDVFPFYLLKSGKVIAAYNESSPSGGNNMEHLKVNVVYDDYSGPNRALKLLMKDANFRSAACAVGYIKSSKYCDGKVQYDLCKDMTRDCRMMLKEPIKIF